MPTLSVGNKSTGEGYIAALGTLTKLHTVATGSNRVLLVSVNIQDITGTPNVSTVTYAGSSMTLVTSSLQVHTFEQVSWYYLIAPTQGANNVVVTITGAAEDCNMIVGVADYYNHNGSAPVGNFKSTATVATAVNTGSIAYTDGDVVVASQVSGQNGAFVAWTNGTEWYDEDFSSMHSSDAAYTAAGSGNVTMTATSDASQLRLAISAVRISPVALTPSITSVSQIYPGGLVTVVMADYASAPLTANCTLNGVPITLEAGATTTGCTFYAPAESTYLFGGSRATHRWYTNSTLTIANASDTANSTVQVTAQSSDQIAARSAASLVNAIDSYNGGLTVATSDDVYQYSSPADSFTPYPATNDFTALEPSFTLYTKFYDVSASSWSGLTTLAFPAAAAPGGGTLSITSTLIAQNPPGTLTPTERNLTLFGGLDWLKTARLTTQTFDTKSGGSMIAAPANIGTPAWTRAEGDAQGHPLVTWTNGAELGTNVGERFYDYTTVNGAGQRFTLSPAGALVKIYFLAGGYNAPTFDVDVSFSDSSATAVEQRHTPASLVHEFYLYEITAQPAGGAATIQVDFSKISGGGLVGWMAIAVESGTSGALYSLTSADTTVTPGQVVRQTLTGGPFQGAITAAYAVYGAVEVPLSWTVISPTLTDVTFPSLSAFAAGQLAEALPWYANFTIRLVAGAESADSPNTNQVVAPVPGDYGVVAVPPWGYPPSNAQELDKAYIQIISGAATVTPETFNVTATIASIRIYTFNIATARWLIPREISFPSLYRNRQVGGSRATLKRGML